MATDKVVHFAADLPQLLTERIEKAAIDTGIKTDEFVRQALEREVLILIW